MKSEKDINLNEPPLWSLSEIISVLVLITIFALAILYTYIIICIVIYRQGFELVLFLPLVAIFFGIRNADRVDDWAMLICNGFLASMALVMLYFFSVGSKFDSVFSVVVSVMFMVRYHPLADSGFIIGYTYVILLMTYFLVPVSVQVLYGFVIQRVEIIYAFFLVLLIVPYIYWYRHLKIAMTDVGFVKFSMLFAMMTLLGMLITASQNPISVFTALDDGNINQSFVDDHFVSDDALKEFFVDSYLWSYRYLISKDKLYASVQMMYFFASPIMYPLADALFSPWIYQGNSSDWSKSEYYFTLIYDSDIQKEFSQEVSIAKSHFAKDSWEARNSDIDSQTVLVTKRETTKTIYSETRAVIEIHETYRNVDPLGEEKEVLYYISLPKRAVITSAYLGKDDKKVHSHLISPRGAAQKVFEQQVKRRIDPAMIEQVGPTQYRFRVFPVIASEELDFWFRYEISTCDEQQDFDLPVILQKRNVFDDYRTIEVLNEEHIQVSPPSSPVQISRVGKLENIPHFAVLVDTSYSMKKHSKTIHNLLRDTEMEVSSFDIYLTSPWVRNEGIRNKTGTIEIEYFGGHSMKNILNQYSRSAICSSYEVLILITDNQVSDLKEFRLADQNLNWEMECDSSLFFVHVDEVPTHYEDDVFDLITTKGGVSRSVVSALKQYEYLLKETTVDVSDECIWSREKDIVSKKLDNRVDAARIITSLERKREDIEKRHDIAVKNSVVTSVSSMIVLINQRQIEDLKWSETQEDKFERKSDSGHEVLGLHRRLPSWQSQSPVLSVSLLLIVLFLLI